MITLSAIKKLRKAHTRKEGGDEGTRGFPMLDKQIVNVIQYTRPVIRGQLILEPGGQVVVYCLR